MLSLAAATYGVVAGFTLGVASVGAVFEVLVMLMAIFMILENIATS